MRAVAVLAVVAALSGCASANASGLLAPAAGEATATSGATPASTVPVPAPTPTASDDLQGSDGSSTAATGAAAVDASAFAAQAAALDDAHRSTLSIAALDLTTGASVSYNPVATFYTASIVKVDLVEAMLLRAQDKGRALTATEAAWARAAITVSDNDAASDIFASLGRADGLTSYNVRLGLTGTVVASAWGLTRTCAADQLRLLQNLTTDSVLSAASRTTLTSLMSQVTASQQWGVPVAGDGSALVKNGWLSYAGDGGGWIVNSIGVVTAEGHTVLVAVLSRKGLSEQEGITEVQQAATLAVSALTG